MLKEENIFNVDEVAIKYDEDPGKCYTRREGPRKTL